MNLDRLGLRWPDDVAPGDRRESVVARWREFQLHVVESASDPAFDKGFRLLDEEFGPRGELEPRPVLANRLAWNPRHEIQGCALLYRMMLVRQGAEVVAVRDHTAIHLRGSAELVVHLSHARVLPAWQRRGLSGLLRALPLQTSRQCSAAAGCEGAPTVLVAEMEPRLEAELARAVRLQAYEKAGFLKVDPELGYRQPDLRRGALIEAAGGPRPLPLDLVVRRVGRELESAISGGELQHIVQSLYAVYAVHCRAQDMRPLADWSAGIGARRAAYRLLPPASA